MTFTLIFIAALLLSVGMRHWLAMRQIRHVALHRASVPNEFASRVSLADHQKAADYTIAKLRFGLLENAFGAFVLIGFTLLGGLEWLNQTLLSMLGSGIAQQMLLLVSLALISGILDLPFTWKKQFGIEAAFGFNRMTPRLFWLDTIKGIALAAALGLPLLWLVLELMATSGSYWWLWTWIVWTLFNALLLWLFPTVIAPLFNKFKALEDGPLKTQIEQLLKRCDFASQGLFVMDGSKRSAHGNAYFTGIGKAKRIVFFDTLIEKLEPLEVEAV
ncbi:MAG: M48 family peptidase, partial [Burkholderiaceae bacterium]|nr:M48 family peptidase [Burkholderiaceae bacterium]